MGSIRTRKGKKGVSYQALVERAGIGKYYREFQTQQEAKDWIAQLESEISLGRTPTKTKVIQKFKFEDLVDSYLDSPVHLNKSPKTQYTEVAKLKGHKGNTGPLMQAFKGMSLNHITTDKINTYLKDRSNSLSKYGKPIGSDSIRLEKQALKQIFTYARQYHKVKLADDPFVDTQTFKGKRRLEIISTNEHLKIRDALEKRDDDKKLLHFYCLAIECGLRAGEIQALTPTDIHLNERQPYVFVSNSKNGESRSVPIFTDELKTMLKYRLSKVPVGCKYVFWGTKADKKTFRPFDYLEGWKCLQAKNITDKAFHQTRHTAITHLFENSAGIYTTAEIMKITGHKDYRSVNIYTHIQDKTVLNKAKKLSDSFIAHSAYKVYEVMKEVGVDMDIEGIIRKKIDDQKQEKMLNKKLDEMLLANRLDDLAELKLMLKQLLEQNKQ